MNTRELLQRLTRDIESDPFLSLSFAANLLPGERPGRGVSPATIYRWGTKGLPLPDGRVVKLAIWRIGRKWVTTRGALARFIAAQQPVVNEPPPSPCRAAADQQVPDEVARALRDAGI